MKKKKSKLLKKRADLYTANEKKYICENIIYI